MQPISNAARHSPRAAAPAAVQPQAQAAPDAAAQRLADACWTGDLAALRDLIAAGCDLNAPGATGKTALSIAAQRGHADVVAALLEAGADVNARCPENDWTALMHAASSGHLTVMQMLIARPHIDLDHANKFGMNALMAAARAVHDQPFICLLKAGAGVSARYDLSYEMVEHAIMRRNVEMVRLIVGQCQSHASSRWRQFALDLAAKHHCAGGVECLLFPGARRHTQGGIEPTLRVGRLAAGGEGGHAKAVLEACEAKAWLASAPAQSEPEEEKALASSLGKVRERSNYLETLAIADLFACSDDDGAIGFQALVQEAEPLSVLKGLIAESEYREFALNWCDRHQILMVIGIRLADLLRQSGAELPLLAYPGCEVNSQQRAVFHAAALNMLQQVQPGAAPAAIYAAAGLSPAGVQRLAQAAERQLDALKTLSERIMVALAEPMLEQLMPICRQHTGRSDAVDAGALRASLVEAGFLPPLAHAIAESWEAGLAKLGTMPLEAPPNVTIAQAQALLDQAKASRLPPLFAAALQESLRQRQLLTDFRMLTGDVASSGVLDHVFQVQCDQLRQYCAQLASE